jgi:hypothetical protein
MHVGTAGYFHIIFILWGVLFEGVAIVKAFSIIVNHKKPRKWVKLYFYFYFFGCCLKL